jgi:hypothetical protein
MATKEEMLELYRLERERIAAANAITEAKFKAAKEQAERQNRDATQEAKHVVVVQGEVNQDKAREEAERQAAEERERDLLAAAELAEVQRVQEQARLESQEHAAKRSSEPELDFQIYSATPLDDSEAWRLEAEAKAKFPADTEMNDRQYLLLRDGTLLILPNVPHRTMWGHFIDMPLFLARSGAIRVFVTSTDVTAEMFSATYKQKQVLLKMIDDKGRFCLQRFLWSTHRNYYQLGLCISKEFLTSLRAAETLNQFLA